ncbi:lysophospholipid acyltransferase family protein [Sphaerotilus mobilis]|uniref:1-acyl-sn-glycerol-3-phosphate acyltransferase n=1 Tax=Sphaerotilus mobilis TaxID=47994 RepID=A0A4Q7LK64_9BURK|nr:lysophospholipid acyltransferase family protein [Sphaerotilus mobilis]RZS54433.1 1-acyl-sn-glycerol-3-phosphate acyltransferase [Sphaerotilus mobilis]
MLKLLRSALYLAWLTITVIPWALLAVILSPVLPRTKLYWFCVGWLKLSIKAATWICGVKYRVQGLENVPDARDGQAAVLLAPKHQSTWETFAMPAIMPHPLAYVFKRELLWIPFFGWAIGRLDMVHIDRSRRAEAWRRVQEQGQRLMSQGNWVIMFPEGTRTPRGSQGPYKTGATRLAIATGTPIVPIAVTSARCWPRKSFLLTPGTIDVSIGRPIPVEGRQADELMAEVEAWIESEMRRLDPEAYPANDTARTASVISATSGTKQAS